MRISSLQYCLIFSLRYGHDGCSNGQTLALKTLERGYHATQRQFRAANHANSSVFLRIFYVLYGSTDLNGYLRKSGRAPVTRILSARDLQKHGVVLWWRELRPPYPMPGFPSTIINTHTSSINYRSQDSGSQLVCGEETVRDVSVKCNYGRVRRIIATSWTYTFTRKACTRERKKRYIRL